MICLVVVKMIGCLVLLLRALIAPILIAQFIHRNLRSTVVGNLYLASQFGSFTPIVFFKFSTSKAFYEGRVCIAAYELSNNQLV